MMRASLRLFAALISCLAGISHAQNAWEVVSQEDWAKATSALEQLSLKEGVISGEGTFSSVVKTFDEAQQLKSLTLTQTLHWNNWQALEEQDAIAPVGDAPVFLPIGKGDYWLFGRKGKPAPNVTTGEGGKKPKGGGYHGYHSTDMKNWVHHGCVTDFRGKMMTTAEHKDGVFYFYSDIPNDTDPHLYLDDNIYDGINGKPMGLVYEDGPGSDMAIIRDLDGKFHLISENWEPIDAMKYSCDSPLADHAVSPNGIQPFVNSQEPAVDYRTTPTGEISTYKHPHWGDDSVKEYQVHEPEQESFGDWTIVRVGDIYHLFGDWEVVDPKSRTDIIVAHNKERRGRTVIAAHLTASKVSGPYTLRGGIDTGKHPDPTVGFAEGRFYFITQGIHFTSSGPWNEGVSARAGVDSDGDGTIDQWTQWQEVSESYDHTPGYARVIQKTPASIDLSALPAAHAVQFEFKLAGEDDTRPQIDKVVIE